MSEERNNQIRQKDLERISRLRLMDDIFMKTVFRGNLEGVQDMICVILNREDITVTEVRIQDEWPNLIGHSVRLDVTARDAAGKWYNIEIERSREGAIEKRARYHVGALDWNILPAGAEYGDLPEVFIIFITEKDILRHGLPIYTINRTVEETGEPFRDFAHILYVNGAYVGSDPLGKLMADFRETDPKKMHYESIANRAAFFKNTEGGVTAMCEIMEEVRQEGWENGLQIGRQEGRQEGRREGIDIGTRQTRNQFIDALMLLNGEDALLHSRQFRELGITEQEIMESKARLNA